MSHTLENILAEINIVLRTIGELKRAFATRIYSSPRNALRYIKFKSK